MIAQEPFSPIERIGDWDYFRDQRGNLYRTRRWSENQSGPIGLVVSSPGAAFALRMARLKAGLPERGCRAP